ncbi:unnamed protein product [Paramecium octaurelia]|uniref:Uncharacterized protein n=1 Tax=Paramecium octaurelia TaxID=43137 RepID=A0A8S1WHD3_PAROT|nr:unnamed protein product [Paramecium octaurelia]
MMLSLILWWNFLYKFPPKPCPQNNSYTKLEESNSFYQKYGLSDILVLLTNKLLMIQY